MENVTGMRTIVTKAGSESSRCVKSISFILQREAWHKRPSAGSDDADQDGGSQCPAKCNSGTFRGEYRRIDNNDIDHRQKCRYPGDCFGAKAWLLSDCC